jgi:hypothetical protein
LETLARIRELKAIARDMGIPVNRLRRDTGMLKIARLEIPAMVEDPKTVLNRADNVAAKFGTFKFDATANKDAQLLRDLMRRDPAAIAARKIVRAIPADKAALVTTAIGHEIVTISRVERAASVPAIERQLKVAIARQAVAMKNHENKAAIAARKTILDRTPKEAAVRAARAAGIADRHTARVRYLRRKLNAAKRQQTAQNLVAIRVGDVRLSLRPQSMANRVARLIADIPARKDVNPIRDYLKCKHAREIGRTAETEFFRLEDERERAEREAQLEAESAERKAARRAEIAARIAANLAADELARKEKLRVEYNARQAMAAKERRRRSKVEPRKFKK